MSTFVNMTSGCQAAVNAIAAGGVVKPEPEPGWRKWVLYSQGSSLYAPVSRGGRPEEPRRFFSGLPRWAFVTFGTLEVSSGAGLCRVVVVGHEARKFVAIRAQRSLWLRENPVKLL